MSHTKGKLRIGTKYTTDIYADRAGHAIARTVNPQSAYEDEANARRLVACWNACDGMRLEDIEALSAIGNGVASLIVYGDDIKKQRDELLRELTNATPPHPGCGNTVGECVASNSCGCSMGATIAKVKGEKL